jgi:hypothetical protein
MGDIIHLLVLNNVQFKTISTIINYFMEFNNVDDVQCQIA